MQTVYMTVGIIGSGKSTWAEQHINDSTVVVCKDALRTMLGCGKYIYSDAYEPLVLKWAKTLIKLALGNGFNVIIDETHTTKARRKETINLVNSYCEWSGNYVEIVYVYFPEKEKNLDRRMLNSRGVSKEAWKSVYLRMLKEFEEPEEEEIPHGKIVKIS